MKSLALLVSENGLHAEPADDCGSVRLFVDSVRQSDAYRDAFALSDFLVSSVNGPFLFMVPKETRRDLFHAMPDGFPSKDAIMREAYGKIPVAVDGKFQHNYGADVPLAVYGWQWSQSFGRWSALVLFEDGWRGFTYPRTWSVPVEIGGAA